MEERKRGHPLNPGPGDAAIDGCPGAIPIDGCPAPVLMDVPARYRSMPPLPLVILDTLCIFMHDARVFMQHHP